MGPVHYLMFTFSLKQASKISKNLRFYWIKICHSNINQFELKQPKFKASKNMISLQPLILYSLFLNCFEATVYIGQKFDSVFAWSAHHSKSIKSIKSRRLRYQWKDMFSSL